jgi:hypothetical protein
MAITTKTNSSASIPECCSCGVQLQGTVAPEESSKYPQVAASPPRSYWQTAAARKYLQPAHNYQENALPTTVWLSSCQKCRIITRLRIAEREDTRFALIITVILRMCSTLCIPLLV